MDRASTETKVLAPVTAICMDCRRGFVYVNPANPRPTCHACGGLITSITPRPNAWPFTDGAFVTDEQP